MDGAAHIAQLERLQYEANPYSEWTYQRANCCVPTANACMMKGYENRQLMRKLKVTLTPPPEIRGHVNEQDEQSSLQNPVS